MPSDHGSLEPLGYMRPTQFQQGVAWHENHGVQNVPVAALLFDCPKFPALQALAQKLTRQLPMYVLSGLVSHVEQYGEAPLAAFLTVQHELPPQQPQPVLRPPPVPAQFVPRGPPAQCSAPPQQVFAPPPNCGPALAQPVRVPMQQAPWYQTPGYQTVGPSAPSA